MTDKPEHLEMARRLFNELRDARLAEVVDNKWPADYPNFEDKLIKALGDWLVSNGKIFSNRPVKVQK